MLRFSVVESRGPVTAGTYCIDSRGRVVTMRAYAALEV